MSNESKISNFCEGENVQNRKVDFRNLNDSFAVIWKGDLDSYLEMIRSDKIEVLYTDVFRVNYDLVKADIEDKNISKVDEGYEELLSLLKDLKKIDGKEILTIIMAVSKGVRIFFQEYSLFANEFFKLEEEITETIGVIESEKKSQPDFEYHLRRKAVKPYAIELAEHPDYHKAILRNSESDILLDSILEGKEWMPKDYHRNDEVGKIILKMDIRELASAHYKMIVEPKIDKERIEKIRKWKSTKMTKVEMASRLGISKDKLNSLYYLAD
jgi:hypothetical protein